MEEMVSCAPALNRGIDMHVIQISGIFKCMTLMVTEASECMSWPGSRATLCNKTSDMFVNQISGIFKCMTLMVTEASSNAYLGMAAVANQLDDFTLSYQDVCFSALYCLSVYSWFATVRVVPEELYVVKTTCLQLTKKPEWSLFVLVSKKK